MKVSKGQKRDASNNTLLHLSTYDGKILKKLQFKEDILLARIEAKEKNIFETSTELTYLNKASTFDKLALINSLAKLEGI